MKKNIILYSVIWIVVAWILWWWIYFMKNKNWETQSENKKTEKEIKVSKETVFKEWTIELWDREVTSWQLWSLDEDKIVDIATKAKEEEIKTNEKLKEMKKNKWLSEDDEIPEEMKKELRVFYDSTDKRELNMNKQLFYTVNETDSFMNPEWFILDEDWNKIFLEPETDENWNEVKKERKDFKNSMYAKECVYMKNPLVTKENKKEEVWRYLEQFKNDLKYFSDESPKFQLSWWIEYIIINLWKLEKWIKEIEKWLEKPFLNPYDDNKPYKNQELQIENKIKDLIQVRKDICEVMFNFPIDKEAPKRDLSWKITIIDNTNTNNQKTEKKSTKTGKKTNKNNKNNNKKKNK